MSDRPLEDIRPLGPVLGENEYNEDNSEIDDESRAIIEQAENWYQSISKEETKKRMMIEYIDGITDDDVPRSKAIKMVEKAGL